MGNRIKRPVSVDERVKLVLYKKEWPALYEKEAANLKRVLGRRILGIEHCGSTAIPGMKTKPIIDILIGIKKPRLSKQARKILALQGYEYIGRARFSDRFYLRKRGKRNFNLAIVPFQGELWVSGIALRDYLRCHPKAAQVYSKMKQKILKSGVFFLFEYSDRKAAFINGVIEKALKWQRGNHTPFCDVNKVPQNL